MVLVDDGAGDAGEVEEEGEHYFGEVDFAFSVSDVQDPNYLANELMLIPLHRVFTQTREPKWRWQRLDKLMQLHCLYKVSRMRVKLLPRLDKLGYRFSEDRFIAAEVFVLLSHFEFFEDYCYHYVE